MKTLLYSTSVLLILWSCNQAANSVNKNEQPVALAADQPLQTTDLSKLFTLTDAEKILGEPAHITENSAAGKETQSYNSAYMANVKDEKSGKTGNVYFMAENYSTAEAASKSYLNIKTMNEKNGIETLKNFGDEAYYHSDGENFYFILARKGTKMFRIKVNKITSKTSKEAFMEVSKSVMERI